LGRKFPAFAILLAVVLLFQATLCGAPSDAGSFNTNKEFNVLVLNTERTKIFKEDDRNKAFKALVKDTDPDILILQEVSYYDNKEADDAEGRKWFESLKDTPIKRQYKWTYDWNRKGLYILSNYRIEAGEVVHHRCQYYIIDTPKRKLLLFNVHLPPGNEGGREKLAARIVEIIQAKRKKDANLTFMVAGDLNCRKGSKPYETLNGKLDEVFTVEDMLDRIFYEKDHLTLSEPRIFKRNRYGPPFSDHPGLSARFTVK
jgi:endonuclease/exonuclease/phosphatase family metal-dependent hydrolase